MLKVKMTKKMGRGVFATEYIKKMHIISINEVILIDLKDKSNDDESIISKYVYSYENKTALALGIGSLFNHSERKCNADWVFRVEDGRVMIVHYATRPIKKGEQIFIDYGYNPK